MYINWLLLFDLPFFRPAEKKVVKITPPTSASEVSVVLSESSLNAPTGM